MLDALAALGTTLSIDDFGTGYSSLAYLRRLPARQIKIDRSFIKDLHTDLDARAIVAAVVGLVHTLGLTVVAEGVALACQRDLLHDLRCDELQGYLFARPVPAPDLLRWPQGSGCPATLRFQPPAPAGPACSTVRQTEALAAEA